MTTFALILLILLATGIGALAASAFNIQWNVFVKAHHQGGAGTPSIALTFDDGPHPIHTPQVLAVLEKHQVKATFFCIGKRAAAYPDLLRAIHEHGHTVGNHSFTHAPSIGFLGKAAWLNEIEQADRTIAAVIGRRPRFFRPPYGVTTPHLAAAIKASGHATIGWRVRPYDTLERPPQRLAGSILRKTKPGHIILLHDTHDRILPLLEQLLPVLKERGFRMVTVAALIERHAYSEE